MFLFVGFSKWEIEKKIETPFFWISEPFLKTKATGFISPKIDLSKGFYTNIIVDTEYFAKTTINPKGFYKKTFFFAETWNSFCKNNAIFMKNILIWESENENIVKQDFKMTSFAII